MDKDDLEIIDSENYKGDGEQAFSHQVLVMRVMNKCIEAGAKEMRQGYYNEKNNKFGEKVLVYVPDTRKEFIESIKTAEMIMICDYDKKATTKIGTIKGSLTKEFNKLCKLEKEYWDKLPYQFKKNNWVNGIFFNEEALHTKLPFYQEYIEYEVNYYRKIFAELSQLSKRLDFYAETDIEL